MQSEEILACYGYCDYINYKYVVEEHININSCHDHVYNNNNDNAYEEVEPEENIDGKLITNLKINCCHI